MAVDFSTPDFLPEAHLDFETRSRTDLRKSGVYRYAEDPTTRPWGFSYRIGHGQIKQWRPGYPDPTDLLEHVAAGGMIKAHNAAFERTVWNWIVCRLICPHWPRIKVSQQDCTMARAAVIAHPQNLEQLASVIGAEANKDKEGGALMKKMAVPKKLHADGTVEWHDSPENIERLMQYCDQDIRTEEAVDKLVPPLTEAERKVWMFDQTINDRGICIDTAAVQRCERIVELAKKEADVEMRRITGRVVPKCTSDAKLIEWIQGRGLDCTTVKKSVQDDLIFMAGLNNDETVREAIELRRSAKKTSTAKYKAMMQCVCSDNRIRGLLNYHGAAPGRWAGRLVQPQNFPRVDYDEEGYIIEWMHELLADPKLSDRDVYDCMVVVHGADAPLRIFSRLLRSVIIAPKGKKLIGGDFSNIEGRINAWLANETWKTQAFADYDTITGIDAKGKPIRKGDDLYKLAYAKSFGIEVREVTKANRQIGKVEELALGYQGSVGAFIDMGDTYGLNPYDISTPIYQATSSRQWDETAMQYHKKGTNKFSLQEKEWCAIKIIVDNWRNANPAIVQSWWDYQDAAVAAVSAPGMVVPVAGGRVSYYFDGNHLWCALPCGRLLCYASARVESERVEYQDKYGETKTRIKHKVTFWGLDSETKQWSKQSLYGGLQCENIVQATARDVMVFSMFNVERAGYPVILTVHDELLTEPEADRLDLNAQAFKNIMSVLPEWAQGLPLSAEAWEDKRYVK